MTSISSISSLLSAAAQTSTTGSSSSTSTSTSSTQATSATDPVSLALQQAQKRITTQIDATIASLSAYGQLQSAVSDTQLAASKLGALTSGTSNADVTSAANDFIAAFNSSVSTASGMATTAGSSTTESRSAARVGRDLDMALTGNSATVQALSAIGITRQADGSLAIDSSKFTAAQQANPDGVRSALASLGQTMDKTTSAELGAGGAIGDPVSALADKSNALIAQQNAFSDAVKQFEDNQAQSSSSSASSTSGAAGIAGLYGGTSGFTGYGLSAYLANS